MDLHADQAGRQPAPNFVPDEWLAELESVARRQVRASPLPFGRRDAMRGWGTRHGVVVTLTPVALLALCVASIMLAMSVGSVALWLAGSFWFIAAGAFSVWVAPHIDAIVDAATR